MKTLSRALALWITLAGLTRLLAADRAMTQPLAGLGLFVLPPLAAWLLATSISALPRAFALANRVLDRDARGGFLLLIMAQGRAEWFSRERASIIFTFGLAAFVAAWVWIKKRSHPTWRAAREMALAVAILGIAAGIFVRLYEAKTRSIAARAGARWVEIGLPMTEFEKTLIRRHENAGSEVVRQVLREQVNAGFYKSGSPVAEHEPPIKHSEATDLLLKQVQDILAAPRPPSDQFDLSSKPVAGIAAAAPSLEADYRRILEADPPAWECDPRTFDLEDSYLARVKIINRSATKSNTIATSRMSISRFIRS